VLYKLQVSLIYIFQEKIILYNFIIVYIGYAAIRIGVRYD